jgi:hypothetical protein
MRGEVGRWKFTSLDAAAPCVLTSCALQCGVCVHVALRCPPASSASLMSLLHAHVSRAIVVQVGVVARRSAVQASTLPVPLPASKSTRSLRFAARRSSSGLSGVAVAAASHSAVDSRSASGMAEEAVFSQPGYRRPLHWVFKVGDLKATLDFYARTLGLKARDSRAGAPGCHQKVSGVPARFPLSAPNDTHAQVHRHEEFASGCEATCNGPFGGAWSKTMVRSKQEDVPLCSLFLSAAHVLTPPVHPGGRRQRVHTLCAGADV